MLMQVMANKSFHRFLSGKSLSVKAVIALFLFIFLSSLQAQQLIVYSDIPGRSPSVHYQCRVRMAGSPDWLQAFVLETVSKPKSAAGEEDNGYTELCTDWTASWINFEMEGTSVEVEIAYVSGAPITSAKVRPESKTAPAAIRNGKAYVIIDSAMNINVDINGQMENQYTGQGGPAQDPVHTISLFANPVIPDRPDVNGAGVYALNPGEQVPSSNTWDVLYFKPGVHNVGLQYILSSNKTLYIPGDAVVHGTVHTNNDGAFTENIRIYGYGALSGENIARINDPLDRTPGRVINGAANNARFEGITLVDPSYHTVIFSCRDQNRPNLFKRLKILGWRHNGDGIHAWRYALVEDCFVRTQDDAFYYSENVHIRNCVIWNDKNGAAIRIVKGGENSSFTDINVIYHRSGWHYGPGGRIISFRDAGPGNTIENVLVRNVLVEDPYPAVPPFLLTMDSNAYSNGDVQVMNNILIENVVQPYPGVDGPRDDELGKPQNTMLGYNADNKFSNITFKNCMYNGIMLKSFADGDFKTNEFHENIVFIVDSVITNVSEEMASGRVPGDQLSFIRVGNCGFGLALTENAPASVSFFDLRGKRLYSRGWNGL